MTILETILILILWINYGTFSAYQLIKNTDDLNQNEKTTLYIIFILFSPAILIVRIILGIFSIDTFKNFE